MSLFKWTLALAGTAMGVRYMSNRHRQRIAGGSHDAQIDRDSGRDVETPWSAAQDSAGFGGLGADTDSGSAPAASTSTFSNTGSNVGSGAGSFDDDAALGSERAAVEIAQFGCAHGQ